MPLNIPELQIAGCAMVTSIDACPPISTGEGNVITGRFVTREVDTVARVEILGRNGEREILEGTTIRPVWSLERQDTTRAIEVRSTELYGFYGDSGLKTLL